MPRIELPPSPWIVGHRGAAGEACENTLAAFDRALASGADMIELDVQLTADGVPVCFHDRDLERLARRSETIEGEPSTMLGEVTISSSGDRMPTLARALDAIPAQTPLNVELKRLEANRAKLASAVLEVLDERPQVLVSSFDWQLLEVVRERAPELPLAPIARYQPGALIEAGRKLDAFSLHCHRRLVTGHFIERAAAEGFERVLAYTINETALAEQLLGDGIAGFFTDFPTMMVEHFRETQ